MNDTFKGVILSGSPASVRDPEAPFIDTMIFRKKLPLLGVCYGSQLLAHQNGGSVQPSKNREYGRAFLSTLENNASLFLKNVNQYEHYYSLLRLPFPFPKLHLQELSARLYLLVRLNALDQ